MKLPVITTSIIFAIAIGVLLLRNYSPVTGAPPYDGSSFDNVNIFEEQALLHNWKRPDGPAKVALQVGHWQNDEVPDELYRLRGNTGATGGGRSEWEVNHAIAEKTAVLLREKGVRVELLPATVPQQYWVDVFVSIHADGNLDSNKSGFKAAIPRRDATGNGNKLLTAIENAYQTATDMEKDPNVTRNMTGYYAFSWWRYEHAVHPMTTAAILETGFLTSPEDRKIIVDTPERSAEGLASGIIQYLEDEQLI